MQLWFFAAEPRSPYAVPAIFTAWSLRLLHGAGWAAADPRSPIWFFQKSPPLIAILPLPFLAVMGPTYHAAQLAAFVCLVAALGFIYLSGRELSGSAGGLLSVWLATTMPMLYGPFRYYLNEAPMAALAAASLYACLRAQRAASPGARAGALIGVLAGLGLLLKVSFPLYALGPILALTLERFRRGERAAVARAALAAALACAALCGWWYPFHWRWAFGYAWTFSFGATVANMPPQFAPVGQLAFWRALAADGLGWPAVAVAAAAAWQAVRRRKEWSLRGAARWAAPGLGLALPLGVHAAVAYHFLRYFTPALPCAAVLIGGGAAAAFPASSRGRGATALAAAAGSWLLLARTFGAGAAMPTTYLNPPFAPAPDAQTVVEHIRVAAGPGRARVAADFDAFPVAWADLVLADERRGYEQEFVDASEPGAAPSRCVLTMLDARGRPRPAPPAGERLLARFSMNPGLTAALYGAGRDCRPPARGD